MSDYLPFQDISQWQGTYNMAANTDQIIAIRMSSGDVGLHFDSRANANYDAAKAAGKSVMGYHYAGGGDPTAEANFFIEAMSPLAENDVLALDWEISNADPVGWCGTFMAVVHAATSVWPLIYLNISTLNGHDWSPVLKHCGLWLAAPSWGFDQTITEISSSIVYVAQQGPVVGGVDSDAWFGTLAQFQAYGFHTVPVAAPALPPSVVTPEPAPAPTPPPATVTVTPTTGTAGTAIDVVVKPKPVPAPPTKPTPVVVTTPKEYNFIIRFIRWFFS